MPVSAATVEAVSKTTTMSFSLGSAAVVVASVLPVSLFAYHLHLSRRKKGEPPVRWSWLPVLGYALEMGNRPLELLTECAKQYGEIFGLVVAGNRLFIITDPHSYQLIFTKNKDLSSEEFHTSVATNMFGATPSVLGTTFPPIDILLLHPTRMYVLIHPLPLLCLSDKHHSDDDLMRSWYSKHLFSDASLQALTTRMQLHLKNHLIPNVEDGFYSNMYDLLGRLAAYLFIHILQYTLQYLEYIIIVVYVVAHPPINSKHIPSETPPALLGTVCDGC